MPTAANTLIAGDGPYVWQAQLSASVDTSEFGSDTALWHDASTGTDWAVVGAPSEDRDAGAVYVYRHDLGASGWSTNARITPSAATPDSAFGAAVALDGNTLVVGAPRHQNVLTIGAAYVFVREAVTGTWTQQGDELNARIGAFGGAVAISGDEIVIGDASLNRVYPYERSGTLWNALTPIDAPSDMLSPSFGTRLWMKDTDLLVSAPSDSRMSAAQGSCALYSFSRGAWDLQHILRPTIDTSAGQAFCRSAARTGERIFVGAPRANGKVGALDVFRLDPMSGAWLHQAQIAEPAGSTAPAPGSLFGTSVAAIGNTVAVGAVGGDLAFVFRVSGNALPLDSTLSGNAGSAFGASVSASSLYVLVGANTDGAKAQGAAHVFLNDRIFADGVE